MRFLASEEQLLSKKVNDRLFGHLVMFVLSLGIGILRKRTVFLTFRSNFLPPFSGPKLIVLVSGHLHTVLTRINRLIMDFEVVHTMPVTRVHLCFNQQGHVCLIYHERLCCYFPDMFRCTRTISGHGAGAPKHVGGITV